MTIIYAVEAERLVKLYSMELETRLPPGSPAHALGQVLYHEARNQNPQPSPWRKFFEAGELVHGDRYIYSCCRVKNSVDI